jgi:hypothetical protein
MCIALDTVDSCLQSCSPFGGTLSRPLCALHLPFCTVDLADHTFLDCIHLTTSQLKLPSVVVRRCSWAQPATRSWRGSRRSRSWSPTSSSATTRAGCGRLLSTATGCTGGRLRIWGVNAGFADSRGRQRRLSSTVSAKLHGCMHAAHVSTVLRIGMHAHCSSRSLACPALVTLPAERMSITNMFPCVQLLLQHGAAVGYEPRGAPPRQHRQQLHWRHPDRHHRQLGAVHRRRQRQAAVSSCKSCRACH